MWLLFPLKIRANRVVFSLRTERNPNTEIQSPRKSQSVPSARLSPGLQCPCHARVHRRAEWDPAISSSGNKNRCEKVARGLEAPPERSELWRRPRSQRQRPVHAAPTRTRTRSADVGWTCGASPRACARGPEAASHAVENGEAGRLGSPTGWSNSLRGLSLEKELRTSLLGTSTVTFGWQG